MEKASLQLQTLKAGKPLAACMFDFKLACGEAEGQFEFGLYRFTEPSATPMKSGMPGLNGIGAGIGLGGPSHLASQASHLATGHSNEQKTDYVSTLLAIGYDTLDCA